MNVWVVMLGEYSDKAIGPVFSTEDAAKRYALMKDGYAVEVTVDAEEVPAVPDEVTWCVRVTERDGSIVETRTAVDGLRWSDWHGKSPHFFSNGCGCEVYVRAPFDREDLAMKIALEKRATAVASHKKSGPR